MDEWMHRALLYYDTGYHEDRVKIGGGGGGEGRERADGRGSLVCVTPLITVSVLLQE